MSTYKTGWKPDLPGRFNPAVFLKFPLQSVVGVEGMGGSNRKETYTWARPEIRNYCPSGGHKFSLQWPLKETRSLWGFLTSGSFRMCLVSSPLFCLWLWMTIIILLCYSTTLYNTIILYALPLLLYALPEGRRGIFPACISPFILFWWEAAALHLHFCSCLYQARLRGAGIIRLIMSVWAFSNCIFSLLCSQKVPGTYREIDYESELRFLTSLMSTDTYRERVPLANYLVSNHSSCPCHETKKQKEYNRYRLGSLTRKIYPSGVAWASGHAMWKKKHLKHQKKQI